jgi:hypothetical protein
MQNDEGHCIPMALLSVLYLQFKLTFNKRYYYEKTRTNATWTICCSMVLYQ